MRNGSSRPSRRGPRSERDVARRTMSQNFLRGRAAVDLYLDLVDVDPGGLVVEVGSGPGAVTEALSPRCRQIIAYELDPATAEASRSRLSRLGNVTLVVGDFLESRPPTQPFQVVGNLPFGQTSAIIGWCLAARSMTTATVITQLEYARKRTGWYGRWSLLTIQSWPWFEWELRGRIDKSRFQPAPRVDAGVLHIVQRERQLIPGWATDRYARMVDLGFSGLGGTLFASLSRRYRSNAVAAAFDRAGLSRDLVVASVSPEAWLDLFDVLELDR